MGPALNILCCEYHHTADILLLSAARTIAECPTFDFSDVIGRHPAFAPLREVSRFKAFIITDILEWENESIDISPEYVYKHGSAA